MQQSEINNSINETNIDELSTSNENTISDYFYMLLHSDEKVYLVTGTEMLIEGADREPLLMDVTILKEITHYYRHLKE